MKSPVKTFQINCGDRLITRFQTEAGSDPTTFNDPDAQVIIGEALQGDPFPRVVMRFQLVEDRVKDRGGFDVVGIFRCWGKTEVDCDILASTIISELADDDDILTVSSDFDVLAHNNVEQDDPVPSYEEDEPFFLIVVRITWRVYEAA